MDNPFNTGIFYKQLFYVSIVAQVNIIVPDRFACDLSNIFQDLLPGTLAQEAEEAARAIEKPISRKTIDRAAIPNREIATSLSRNSFVMECSFSCLPSFARQARDI